MKNYKENCCALINAKTTTSLQKAELSPAGTAVDNWE